MDIECDVLVVGAGPAGAVTSLVCSKSGLDTIVLEKNPRIGSHTKTKVDASPDGELSKIINELKLKTENKVFSSKWYSPSGSYFLLKSSSPEYFFKRGPDEDSFEAVTIEQVKGAGGKLFSETKIEGLKELGGHVDYIVVKRKGETLKIKPRILVAADGANSMFHKFVYKRSENRRKVAYGVSGKDFSDTSSSNIYFDADLMPGGYFYLITGESKISSAAVVLDSSNIRGTAREYYEKFLKANKDLAEKVEKPLNYFAGEGPIFDIDKYVNKNIVFVGDAAGLIDPFFGYGMNSAIVSGFYAGNFIKKALKEDLALLQKYDKTIKEKFDKRLAYLYQRVFESLKNDDLDLIAEILNELDKKTDMDMILRQLSGKVIK